MSTNREHERDAREASIVRDPLCYLVNSVCWAFKNSDALDAVIPQRFTLLSY